LKGKTMPEQPVEEVLEHVWTVAEQGREVTDDDISSVLPPGPLRQTLRKMIGGGLIEKDGNRLRLTPMGNELAEQVVRRHRLAERLLTDVLDVGTAESETSACQFEHCLSAEVADSICTLLGHPRTCPHGKPIPPGECCRAREKAPSPIVVPLSDLQVGQQARIVYILSHRNHRLDRLTSLGLLPGSTVRLDQRSPSFVVSVGESEAALASSIAHEIYVRPFGRSHGPRGHGGPRRFPWRRGRWK